MDLPAASQQIVPMATGFDPHPYPYPVVEPSNDCRDDAVANSFCLEEDMLALYEAFYPISSSDHHGLTGVYPPPPPHPCLWDETGSRHQLETLQSLQAQQEFQARQQNYYSWPEQHQHHHLQLQQQVVPRKGTAIRKKKKTDQLKTVYRVPAENILNVDKWAWRKYGQKPIKGSPFPRNYYRCSSSKGCAARKQVERSLSEPQVYVVTYTGDHFHPWPLHRNALAGISRSSSHHHNNTLCSPSDPPPPPPPPQEKEEEEEEEGEAVLMIPNSKYVDEDMLRGMHDLANSKLINDLPTFY